MALNCRACALIELARPVEALPLFEAALELRRRYAPAAVPASLGNVAITLAALGRFAEAVSAGREAVAAGERAASRVHRNLAALQLARALFSLGSWDEAVATVEEAAGETPPSEPRNGDRAPGAGRDPSWRERAGTGGDRGLRPRSSGLRARPSRATTGACARWRSRTLSDDAAGSRRGHRARAVWRLRRMADLAAARDRSARRPRPTTSRCVRPPTRCVASRCQARRRSSSRRWRGSRRCWPPGAQTSRWLPRAGRRRSTPPAPPGWHSTPPR